MVGLVVGALIWWFRESLVRAPHRRKLVAAFVIALTAFAAITVYNQLHAGSPHSSLAQRSQVERATRQLWLDHPLTGVGLRFFKTPAYAGYQPPNDVVNEILAEAGIPGLLGFIVFVAGSLVGLARGRGGLATAAVCAVAARFVHGLVDIYWVGGTTALPWLIAGMGLATSARPQLTNRISSGRDAGTA
jgi:O-antigen ligase